MFLNWCVCLPCAGLGSFHSLQMLLIWDPKKIPSQTIDTQTSLISPIKSKKPPALWGNPLPVFSLRIWEKEEKAPDITVLLAGCHYNVQDISQCKTSLLSVLLSICFPPLMLCCCPDGQLNWRQLSCWWFPLPGPFLEHFGRRDTLLQNLTGKILPNADSASFHMSILLFQMQALLSSVFLLGVLCTHSAFFHPVHLQLQLLNSGESAPLEKCLSFEEALEILQHIKEWGSGRQGWSCTRCSKHCKPIGLEKPGWVEAEISHSSTTDAYLQSTAIKPTPQLWSGDTSSQGLHRWKCLGRNAESASLQGKGCPRDEPTSGPGLPELWVSLSSL